MDDHTREFLRREDVEVAGVREKARDVCYRVLKTRKGKKMLKAEAMRLQSLRKKRKKRLSMVRDDTGEKRKLKLRHTFEVRLFRSFLSHIRIYSKQQQKITDIRRRRSWIY